MSMIMIPSIPKITINSRLGDIILEPMRMAKLKAFSDAVEPLISHIFDFLEDDSEKQEKIKSSILPLINKHYDDFVNLVCVACNDVTKEKIDDMLSDDFVNLVGGVIEVNAYFFVKNLLPILKGRVGSIKSIIPQNLLKNKSGQTDTSVSSPTATV